MLANRLTVKTILIASHNKGKVREIKNAFKSLFLDCVSLSDINITIECEETGSTFLDNAIQKANFYHNLTGYPVVSDDSGLEVEILDNAPSIYSGRWAGEDANDEANRAKLIDELNKKGVSSSKARFVSTMVFVDNSKTISAVGVLEGMIKNFVSGANGFGYDPCFYVDGKCVGDMTIEEKGKISHRSKAIKNLMNLLKREQIV